MPGISTSEMMASKVAGCSASRMASALTALSTAVTWYPDAARAGTSNCRKKALSSTTSRRRLSAVPGVASSVNQSSRPCFSQ